MEVSSYCLVSLHHTVSQSCQVSVTEGLTVHFNGVGLGALSSPVWRSAGLGVLVLRINVSHSSVSACALATGACGGDVEQGLGLPQLGTPLQVIHVGCGGLCVRACGVQTKQSSVNILLQEHRFVYIGTESRFTYLLAVVGCPDFGERRDPSVLGA